MPLPARLILFVVAAAHLVFFAITGGGCMVPQSQNVKGKTDDVTEPITQRNYYLYLPKDYDPSKKYPLIVSIHGMKPFDNAFPQLMTWRKICDERGWIAIAPQLRSPDMFNQFPMVRIDDALISDEAQIVASIHDVIRKYNADSRYVMVTGWSSGGFIIHYVAARHPELFSVVAPQGANFHEKIMPKQVSEAARQTPIYIYHGEFDVGVVVEQSNRAIQWYYRHGYKFVRMDTAPGGHERHPELAERFFAGYINGTNVYTFNEQKVARVKQNVLSSPWLGVSEREGSPPTRLASSNTTSSTPTRSMPNGGTSATRVVSNAPANRTASRTGIDQAPVPNPIRNTTPSNPNRSTPGTPVADVRTPDRSKYVWKDGEPKRADVAERTDSATPSRTVTTPPSPWANPRPSRVTDTPSDSGTRNPSITPMPIGPGRRVATRTPDADGTPSRSPATVDNVDRPRTTTREPSRTETVGPISDAQPNVSPRPLPSGSPSRPVASDTNPVTSMKPSGSRNPQPTPVATTPPQVVPVAPSRSGVRVVPSKTKGTAPMTIEFRAEVRNIGAQVTRYRWRLDDILFSTSHFAVLTFQRPGRYPIELTLYDAAGNAYRDRITIRVFASGS